MYYLFYLFAAFLITSSLLVVFNRNHVHSVLFLVLVFINSAILFLLLRAEFIAMLLIIVYIGAVAVLFLFIVIMLGVKAVKEQIKQNNYLIILALIVLLCELYMMFSFTKNFSTLSESVTIIDTYKIGDTLYTDYFYPFQIAGVILLVAMIGVIILTLQHNSSVREQKVMTQVLRRSKLKLVKS